MSRLIRRINEVIEERKMKKICQHIDISPFNLSDFNSFRTSSCFSVHLGSCTILPRLTNAISFDLQEKELFIAL